MLVRRNTKDKLKTQKTNKLGFTRENVGATSGRPKKDKRRIVQEKK